jgi:hypothetical protein
MRSGVNEYDLVLHTHEKFESNPFYPSNSMPFSLSKRRIQTYSQDSLKLPSIAIEIETLIVNRSTKQSTKSNTEKNASKNPINSAQCNEDISSQCQQQLHTSNKPYTEPSTQSPLKTTSSCPKLFKSFARKVLI